MSSDISFFVRIEGWGKPRLIQINDSKIHFEATTCYPCAICDGRIQQLDDGLRRSGFHNNNNIEKQIADKRLFYILPLPNDDCSPSTIVQYISKVFDHSMEMMGNSLSSKLIKGLELQWRPNNSLNVMNNGKTIEWADSNIQAAWISAETQPSLLNGVYSFDFQIDQLCSNQMGVGFLLEPADWGFFGYLGASNRAWSYDPYEGAIVNETKAIYEHLPKFQQNGIIKLELNLKQNQDCSATFIVNGERTPIIPLPKYSIIIVAVSLLKYGQKVTLTNFCSIPDE